MSALEGVAIIQTVGTETRYNMGLDDFTTDDSSTDSSTSSSSDTQTEDKDPSDFDSPDQDISDIEPDSEMSFYGTGNADVGTQPMKRKGAMSNHTTSQLMRHAEGEIHSKRDDIKFHSPTFPVITVEDKYEQGTHYVLKYDGEANSTRWHNRVVTCISSTKTQLGEMNKEVIMMAVGSPSKSIAMERLNESLGDDLSGETTVYINFFGDTMFMRDLAQANMEYRKGERLNTDKIANRLFNRDMLMVGLNQQEDS